MTVVYNFFGQAITTSTTWNDVITTADLVNGTATGLIGANDFFKMDATGGHTLIGNGGNDVFYGVTNTDTIIEPAGYTGIATVYVASNYIMGLELTNMVVFWATSGVYGNSSANYIVSNVANIAIDGGGGNDVFTGSAGDNFRFDANSGFDVITNFAPGGRTSVQVNPETVQLMGYAQFSNFAQVQSAMTQMGADVVLQLDGNDAIKFLNTTIASFSSDNFLLASAPNTQNLTMTFDDEFSSGTLSASTGGLDTLWRTDYGWGSNNNALLAHTLAGTGEKEIYVDPTMVSQATGTQITTDPFSFVNGALDVHAAPAPASEIPSLYGYQYTSGLLSTRDSFTQTYGYFQANIQVPDGGGAWPAFWLYSATGSGAEIDIMESHGNDTWTATTHSFATGTGVSAGSTIYTPGMSSAFHTFGLLWTASTITWYLDGVAVRSIATPTDMNGPMYMMLGLALDSTTNSSFTGADMMVSSVQAYSLDNLPASIVNTSVGNQTLNDLNGATTLVGNTGSDSFYVSNSATQVIATPGLHTGTVYAAVDYTLPTNVAKLIMTGTATQGTSNSVGGTIVGNNNGDVLTGGAGTDILLGGTGNDRLIAGSGVETLTGGGGSDTFAFGPTVLRDYIADYNVANDHLDLSALAGHGYTLFDTGAGAMMDISGEGYILFDNVKSAALVSSGALGVSTMSQNSWSYFGAV